MKNGKFMSTVIRMQNVSRWNQYAPRFKDNAAIHSFRCAAYGVIAVLVEEKVFGKEFDKFKVIGKAIFHDLNETKTGSIKHATKKDPFVREHIRAVEDEVSLEIVSMLSKTLQPTFYDLVVRAEDETFEGRLIDGIDSFDAFMYCKREVNYGSNPIFEKRYEELYEQLKTHEMDSIRWLVEQVEKEEGVYRFLNHILMLDTIDRWDKNFNLVPDNDSSHTYRATAISIFNGVLEKVKFGKEIDLFKLAAKTIFHDLVEEVTGDILGPVKRSNPVIQRAFKLYEKKVGKEMLELLPEFLLEDMTDFMVESKNDTYEGELVKVSDKLEALIKANLEMKVNPAEYASTYLRDLKEMQQTFDNDCVVFFLAYILHDINHNNFD